MVVSCLNKKNLLRHEQIYLVDEILVLKKIKKEYTMIIDENKKKLIKIKNINEKQKIELYIFDYFCKVEILSLKIEFLLNQLLFIQIKQDIHEDFIDTNSYGLNYTQKCSNDKQRCMNESIYKRRLLNTKKKCKKIMLNDTPLDTLFINKIEHYNDTNSEISVNKYFKQNEIEIEIANINHLKSIYLINKSNHEMEFKKRNQQLIDKHKNELLLYNYKNELLNYNNNLLSQHKNELSQYEIKFFNNNIILY